MARRDEQRAGRRTGPWTGRRGHRAGRAGPEPAVLVLAADRPVTRADIPRLCERLHRLLEGTRTGPVTVEAGEHCAADLVTVEALARLRLTAQRLGRGLRLAHADGALWSLLAWAGLEGQLSGLPAEAPRGAPGGAPDRAPDGRPGPGGSAGAEPRRQAEQREQPGGVQERVERGDPPP
ncbi:sulfate transporter [Streptomyces carminius]|uniref:Sulfate transporter n=1 Tax=Streptomyces carminius TaxID=2665496 RepID=A0A2M8LTG7_9ACTN|nr:STAS domain-containing protein [Streptomyces carminius]PJE95252.1 sulfate transporter [Streptomyces carminius]